MGRLVSIARKAKSRAPMEEMTSAAVTVARGVEGDSRGASRQRQVTVLSAEVWAQACAGLGVEVPWTVRRANLLVEDVTLPRAVGARLTVGALELEVTEETAPCERMEEQQAGLRAALKEDWRGGVCCRVLNDAEIAVGDSVAVD